MNKLRLQGCCFLFLLLGGCAANNNSTYKPPDPPTADIEKAVHVYFAEETKKSPSEYSSFSVSYKVIGIRTSFDEIGSYFVEADVEMVMKDIKSGNSDAPTRRTKYLAYRQFKNQGKEYWKIEKADAGMIRRRGIK